MTDRTIAIRNVYVMLAYAFRRMHSDGTDSIAAERFDHLQDLLAEILIRGVGTQVKRGLHRDYLERSDALATVRGRIDITRTIATRSMTRGRLVCEFDEYEPDTPHNQALKSVIVLLLRRGEIAPPRKDALRRLLPYLDAVTLVAPTSVRWNTLNYHRANANYRLLLGVCELIIKGLLPTQDSGTAKLTSWISDDVMSSLYERFLREYFRVHHPELLPSASAISWDYDRASALGADQLPAMLTDLTLRSGGRKLIIDAKYYGKSMQISRWDKSTVHSDNLYQVLAYVKNADVARDGSVSGLLLYARTDAVQQPDLDVIVQGNRIGARTLDLNQPWQALRARLEVVVAEL
ncbi:5-methylcytosine-specific restriction endonuclease system specificity protein McrC [Microbacterium sp. Gd 4-13]|uniref:5-methylcytosine-specific restriction endonuclease system specificity protein McrC n=1 Tax=Microbacterium sp. Gd 4-13 TaxID=2173179 RepID=UPI000D56A633|nr:5-methylcytosine-specific restriction endonuclease system specificity protein McrC [Microbacterium sp. Gd 4-13]PVW06873.1 5-methylcytosine-specific restriction endonuclease system specificity protein McrC [Microbacterium sp. Gd 4-13]